MDKLLQRCSELPSFVSSGIGIMCDPLFPKGLKFYNADSGKHPVFPNAHGRYLFKYVLDGEYEIEIDDVKFHLFKGEAILLRPGVRHIGCSRTGTVLSVAFELSPKENRLRSFCQQVFKISRTEHKFLQASLDAFLQWQAGDSAAAEDAVIFFAGFLHRVRKLNIQENNQTSAIDAQSHLVNKIVEYLAANRDHRVTLDELAHVFHISGSSIRQTFAAKMGRSIGSYELSRRLIYSTELLRSTDLSVAEIAVKCGFATANGLCKALKRAKCLSPVQFRKRYVKKIVPKTIKNVKDT